jgi:hypothetical protein
MAMLILTIFIWSGMISAIVLAANCIARYDFCDMATNFALVGLLLGMIALLVSSARALMEADERKSRNAKSN